MTTAISGIQGQLSQQATAGQDALNKVDLNQFLKMLIAELQNQDPMNPMSNSEIVQQVSQIQAIQTNQQLNQTLTSVQLGQNVATAGALMYHTISGLSDSNQQISGSVDGVSIENGALKLHVGQDTVDLKNVSEILP
jgi:flagellar basal-body rod modification protein FlgD